MPTNPPSIVLEDVILAYGASRARWLVSLDRTRQHLCADRGNGAGKSTTLSMLLGFAIPQSGSISVGGIDPVNAPDNARRQVAYLPESVALYEHLSAVENAIICWALSGSPRSRQTIVAALEAAGLQEPARDQRLGGFRPI